MCRSLHSWGGSREAAPSATSSKEHSGNIWAGHRVTCGGGGSGVTNVNSPLVGMRFLCVCEGEDGGGGRLCVCAYLSAFVPDVVVPCVCVCVFVCTVFSSIYVCRYLRMLECLREQSDSCSQRVWESWVRLRGR